MKKRLLFLVAALLILSVGCGKKIAEEVVVVVEDAEVVVEETSESAETVELTQSEELEDYMVLTKEYSDTIKASLENDVLTQLDMNMKSQELYELWDEALNYLWGEVKNTLSEDEFAILLDQQRVWIADKEKAVEEAGQQFEGGSMYSLIVNMEAAKITEERAYELYELLK